MTRGLIAIAAGIAVLAGLGTGIGEGLVFLSSYYSYSNKK